MKTNNPTINLNDIIISIYHDAPFFENGVRDEKSILKPLTALKNFEPYNTQYAIMHKIAKINKFGRILIPAKTRESLCINESTAVYIIDRDYEIIIRPIHTKTPDAVEKISRINPPVDDWETMEQEIESGAVNE